MAKSTTKTTFRPIQAMGAKVASRALALPARQVTALCKGAKRAGCIAEVVLPGGLIVRLVPDINYHGEWDDIRL